MYEYHWYQWLLFFYVYCFAGWVFESTYVSIKERRPVNRGFLRLPLLPLYGTGAVMMLFVSLPIQDHPVLVYFAGIVAATLLEYVTGWGMERLFKIRYWDYSGKRFQIRGYICLGSSVCWGFLTIFLTEVLHRPVERLILGLGTGTAVGIGAAVSVLFAADTVESFRTALDLRRALEMVTRMKGDLEELQLQLALLKAQLREQTSEKVQLAYEERAARAAELKEAVAARMNGMRGSAPVRAIEATAALIAEVKEEAAVRQQTLLDKLDVLKGRADDLSARHNELRKTFSPFKRFYLRGLVRGNPTAVSSRYREALEELQRDVRKGMIGRKKEDMRQEGSPDERGR